MDIFLCYFHGHYFLCLCVYCNMNFDKTHPNPFLLPFVKHPLSPICYLDACAIHRYHYTFSFCICFWVQVYRVLITLHHIVVKSGTISWSLFMCTDITLRKPSNCWYESRCACTVASSNIKEFG